MNFRPGSFTGSGTRKLIKTVQIDPKLTTVKLVESDGIIGGGDVEVWLSLCCDEDLASCHAHTEPQKLSLRAGSKFYSKVVYWPKLWPNKRKRYVADYNVLF